MSNRNTGVEAGRRSKSDSALLTQTPSDTILLRKNPGKDGNWFVHPFDRQNAALVLEDVQIKFDMGNWGVFFEISMTDEAMLAAQKIAKKLLRQKTIQEEVDRETIETAIEAAGLYVNLGLYRKNLNFNTGKSECEAISDLGYFLHTQPPSDKWSQLWEQSSAYDFESLQKAVKGCEFLRFCSTPKQSLLFLSQKKPCQKVVLHPKSIALYKSNDIEKLYINYDLVEIVW